MLNRISVNAQNSIKISGEPVIYIDPFMIEEGDNDADIIFITHEHHDHLSAEDIRKVCKEGTLFVVPESCKGSALGAGIKEECMVTMNPGDVQQLDDISVYAVPAYNMKKEFHKKTSGWLGYVLTIDDTKIYIAGDTDNTKEARKVECDIAMLPIGGTYTMDAEEAASLVNEMKPKTVIPTHYGSIVGDMDDENKFMEKVDPGIWVALKI